MSQEYNAKQKKSNQHSCPSCGAPLAYSPKTGTLFCEHCGTKVDIERNLNVRERDFTDMNTTDKWKESDVTCYRCANCGASTILSAITIATECPYCGSAVVIDNESLDSVRPDTVIPFEATNEEATAALLKWRKKRLLAPNSFRKHLSVDLVKGTYQPIWTFDAYTTSPYSGRLGKRRTRTVKRGKTVTTETYIQWFHVSGSIDYTFDDVFVRGNDNIETKWLQKLQPFPQQKYVVYEDAFLSGYIADNYTVPPQEAFEIAKQKMRTAIERAIVERYNADVVGELNVDLQFRAKSFKYLMIPVYITATKYNNKLYNNYVSGVKCGTDNRNNPIIKVSGKAPLSALKITMLVLAILVLLAAIVFVAAPFFNDMPILEYWQQLFNGTLYNDTYPPNFVGQCNKTVDNLCALGL